MTKIRIGGVEIDLVSEADAEQATVVVCSPVSYFTDDVRTVCGSCGETVFHRPFVPTRPPKMCAPCFLAMIGPKQ
jgi:hypothetical protein